MVELEEESSKICEAQEEDGAPLAKRMKRSGNNFLLGMFHFSYFLIVFSHQILL